MLRANTPKWLYTVFILLMGITAKAQWQLDSTGISPGYAAYTSIAIDTNNIPYIAYRDFTNSGKLAVAKYNGTNWEVDSTGISSDIAEFTTLDFDNNNVPFIAFRDNANSGRLAVAKHNGTNWEIDSTGITNEDVLAISMAFDSSNHPYIAYQDDINGDKLCVAKHNGTNWEVDSIGISAGIASNISIAFDNNNTPYISFRDNANSSKLAVAKHNGTNWYIDSTGISGSTATYTSMAFDNNNTPFIAFTDWNNSFTLAVAKHNGTNWYIDSTGISTGNTSYVDMVLDNNGMPYIVYRMTSVQEVHVATHNGVSWTDKKIDVNFGYSSYLSIDIGSNYVPYIAYTDASSSAPSSNNVAVISNLQTVWIDNAWSNGTPDSSRNAIIHASTTPSSFACRDLTIDNSYSLNTGTSGAVDIYGDVYNNGNGASGTGSINFNTSDTANIYENTLEHEGTITVSSGKVLQTNDKLRLVSNATNTGRIGESDGTIIGNVSIQRYMPGKRCFRFLGHPFSSSIALSQLTDEIDITGNGGSTNGFTNTLTNNPSAYWFDASVADTVTSGNNSGWTAFTSATTSDWDQYELVRLLVRGTKGQGLTGGSYTPSASTVEAVGAVNQGTQVVTLTKGSNSPFVGCGNPFPSPVQMNTVAKGSNIGANYYVWDATSGTKGAYVTNPYTMSYILPAYGALFTTASANTNNTLTFEEADKAAGGADLFKTTGLNDWVELTISDSNTKWDRLLINLNGNGVEVKDQLDAVKLYNPSLDFFTISTDDVRLAVDVRPYVDNKSILLGLTAYNLYNKYVIRTGEFNIPAGAKLILHDKYLNKKEELKAGFEYWFEVTADSNSQGINRFEINMAKEATSITGTTDPETQIQLIPNPAQDVVKVAFRAVKGIAQVKLVSITGRVVYASEINASNGDITIPLANIPAGIYIVKIQSQENSFSEKLIVK